MHGPSQFCLARYFPFTLHVMKKGLITLLLAGVTILSAQPDTVRAGAYIISIHDINFHNKEYTSRFWLWFLHKNPEFDFTTQLDITNAKSIETPEAIIDTVAGKHWTMMKMKCIMKENWRVHDFPFDEQHLVMNIENSIYDINSLVFAPDVKGSLFGDEETIDGWQIKNFKIKADTNSYKTGFGDPRPGRQNQIFSELKIEMDISRNAFGLFMKIFIGMYIAFLISMLSFTPHPSELEPRFGLPVGGLFAAVGNKYIIDSLLPETSDFTLVDTLHAMTFMAIFMTLLISAFALKMHDKGNTEQSLRLSQRGARIIISTYVVLNVFFIVRAII
jgi:hypothetical protein